jgi:hypothetical protein
VNLNEKTRAVHGDAAGPPELGETRMGGAYFVDTKLLGHWSYGPLELVTCEINPRTGPANVCRGIENDGRRWLSATGKAAITDWEPEEYTEWRFGLYLLDGDWGVLFGSSGGSARWG